MHISRISDIQKPAGRFLSRMTKMVWTELGYCGPKNMSMSNFVNVQDTEWLIYQMRVLKMEAGT